MRERANAQGLDSEQRHSADTNVILTCKVWSGLRSDDDGSGGAIYANQSASIDIQHSSFVGNSADYGGAIFADQRASIDIQHSSFVGNSAGGSGGAIYVVYAYRSVSIDIQHSSFVGNSAQDGGAIHADHRTSIDIQHSSFVGNSAPAGGDHIFANVPVRFFVFNTTFDPFVRASAESVSLNVLAGCEQYSCSRGFGCTYTNYSLACSICPSGLIAPDGIRCTPCPAGTQPNAAKIDCVRCTNNQYSTYGVCDDCPSPNVVSPDRTSCSPPFECGAGHECTDPRGCGDARSGKTQCSPCPVGSVSSSGANCVACSERGKVANPLQTTCIPCGAGKQPSANRSTCDECSTIAGAKVSMF
eukprot:COSAG02_NODE_14777_length_1237_cov_1.283831_1_plen_357_part_10